MDQHHPGDDPSSRVKVGKAEVEEVKKQDCLSQSIILPETRAGIAVMDNPSCSYDFESDAAETKLGHNHGQHSGVVPKAEQAEPGSPIQSDHSALEVKSEGCNATVSGNATENLVPVESSDGCAAEDNVIYTHAGCCVHPSNWPGSDTGEGLEAISKFFHIRDSQKRQILEEDILKFAYSNKSTENQAFRIVGNRFQCHWDVLQAYFDRKASLEKRAAVVVQTVSSYIEKCVNNFMGICKSYNKKGQEMFNSELQKNLQVIWAGENTEEQSPHVDISGPDSFQFLCAITDQVAPTKVFHSKNGNPYRLDRVCEEYLGRSLAEIEEHAKGQPEEVQAALQILKASPEVAVWRDEIQEHMHPVLDTPLRTGDVWAVPGGLVHAGPPQSSFRMILFTASGSAGYNASNQYRAWDMALALGQFNKIAHSMLAEALCGNSTSMPSKFWFRSEENKEGKTVMGIEKDMKQIVSKLDGWKKRLRNQEGLLWQSQRVPNSSNTTFIEEDKTVVSNPPNRKNMPTNSKVAQKTKQKSEAAASAAQGSSRKATGAGQNIKPAPAGRRRQPVNSRHASDLQEHQIHLKIKRKRNAQDSQMVSPKRVRNKPSRYNA